MNKYINFEIESTEIIDNDANSQFATAKIQAFSSSINKHNMICSEEVLQATAPSIYNKPILYTIDKRLDDFFTHVEPEKSLIAGFVVPNSAEFVRLEDSRLSLNVIAKIWKRYAPKVIELFQREKSKKVSVEMELYDSKTREDGLIEMLSFAYAGITLLGDFVTEASPGANMQMLSFSEENEKFKEAVALEFGRYDSMDFTIPSQIRDTAKKSLELYKKYGKGGTSVALAVARFLANNEKATPEKIRQIAKRKPKNIDDKDESHADYISNGLFGGIKSYQWAKKLSDTLDELDNKNISYFGKGELIAMPYKTKEDMNPALKGIDPPISVSQANEIAKQADAIGSDEKKNGWAIAISSFKKSHIVKDGHWVRKDKENMSEDDVDETEPFAKEDNGKGNSITVDKSKDAMSSSPWGNVDKTSLMHKVLNASNYKSLVHDIYLKVDEGWEDHPSSSLHYPVMQINGGKAVYNRYGLSSALQRAEAQNESGVVSKVRGIYNKLGLDKPEKEEMSVKDEKDEEQVEKEKEEEMSYDFSAMFEGEDNFAEMKEEFSKPFAEMNYAKCMSAMYARMCKMSEAFTRMSAEKDKLTKKLAEEEEKSKAYMAENEELKKFKAEKDKEQFDFAVNSTLKEIEIKTTIPLDELNILREKSKEFSLENLSGWINLARSKALDFAIKGEEKESYKKYALPFPGGEPRRNLTNSPWKRN